MTLNRTPIFYATISRYEFNRLTRLRRSNPNETLCLELFYETWKTRAPKHHRFGNRSFKMETSMEDRLDRSFETSKIPADKPLKDVKAEYRIYLGGESGENLVEYRSSGGGGGGGAGGGFVLERARPALSPFARPTSLSFSLSTK